MGRYLTPVPVPVQNGPIKKQQEFKTSGTFTPSPELLAAGGLVTVRCVGGGGGGRGYSINGTGGDSGMDVTRVVRVTGPITVTIGAGGGQAGGATSFGALLSASGGKAGAPGNTPNTPIGEGSVAGYSIQNVFWKGRGGGSGGGISKLVDMYNTGDGAPNTGGGGAANGSGQGGQGGSGLCIVTWEES